MKLTDEQIAAFAPSWATHYDINEKYKCILFESEHLYTILEWDSGMFTHVLPQRLCGLSESSKPIPRKPKSFDITQHEWSDEAKDCGVSFRAPAWVMPDIEINIKDVNGGDNTAVLLREHAIALAKHFGVTAEDLK